MIPSIRFWEYSLSHSDLPSSGADSLSLESSWITPGTETVSASESGDSLLDGSFVSDSSVTLSTVTVFELAEICSNNSGSKGAVTGSLANLRLLTAVDCLFARSLGLTV